MNKPFVHAAGGSQWAIGNDLFELCIFLGPEAEPRVLSLSTVRGQWRPGLEGNALGPLVEASGETFVPGSANMAFTGAEADNDRAELRLSYTCGNDLLVRHHLSPSRDQAAWRSWTALCNPTAEPVRGISRFDAMSLRLGVSDAEPQVAYLLGWLDGPRADMPGRHAIPFPYPLWIPRLLYGDGAPLPPPPSGGWSSPVLRLVRERLTKLPLQSGKRSTYDNHPWIAVLDPPRGGGFFAGFEWSGTWRMDLEHDPVSHEVSLSARTDGCVHALAPGATLTSPGAFIGWYCGDWDGAFGACTRYVGREILPSRPESFPLLSYNFGCPNSRSFGGDVNRAETALRARIDAAANAGIEHFMIDAMWWDESPMEGDFSLGLGNFAESRVKFPNGLRRVSDYVHSRGLKFGLWFEFERVDIRTANRGRNPWSPAWLVHQRGYPYRSWCQHVFLMCLGVSAAADWAQENVSWAIREYGVDWIKIDSNEWAVCDDPAHDHGERDGEWAQIEGLYDVLKGLRQEFPHLIIENCAGGSQRADLGIARYCDYIHCHDTNWPSAISRKYSHGLGCIYPPYYGLNELKNYPSRIEQPAEGVLSDPDHLEWRALSRMMGMFETGWGFSDQNLGNLKRIFEAYKAFRPSLCGGRYVLDGPEVLVERENREADHWEAYEYASPDGGLISVFFFRCLSRTPDHRVRLKGLLPESVYGATSLGGQFAERRSGADWMARGVTCHLAKPRTAEVYLLRRL